MPIVGVGVGDLVGLGVAPLLLGVGVGGGVVAGGGGLLAVGVGL